MNETTTSAPPANEPYRGTVPVPSGTIVKLSGIATPFHRANEPLHARR